MKKINLIILICCFSTAVFSQVLKTSKSQSTVLFDNTNIGFGVTEAELSFNTNNYLKTIIEPNGMLLGGSISGKNNDGLSPLLSGGEFQPTSKFNLVLGYYFSNAEDLNEQLTADFIKKGRILNKEQKSLFDSLTKNLKKNFDQQITSSSLDAGEKKVLTDLVKKHFGKGMIKGIPKLDGALISLSMQADMSDAFEDLTEKLADDLRKDNDYKKYVANIKKRESDRKSKVKKADVLDMKKYYRITLYALGGMNQDNFTRFNGWDQTDPDDSFTKEKFTGSNLGFGLNARFLNNNVIGFRYIREKSNNKATLSKKTFEYSTSEVVNQTTYVQKGSKTAYQGEFTSVMLNRVDLDYVRYFSLSNKNMILLDAYMRISTNEMSDKIANTTDIGISSSFYKKGTKFIGGVYLELPDIDNNRDDLKPTPENKDWYERLSFGVYVKYSLKSLLSASQL